ncbi:MAG: DNA polymerase III subunit alpha [Armatimonadota bacterium]
MCRSLEQGDYKSALRIAAEYREIFGRENYFVELQDHGLDVQKRVNKDLLRIADELGLTLICTNDTHYLDQQDAQAHDVLLCIQTGKRVADEDRLKFDTEEFYLKTPDEMAALFADVQEAVTNTVHLAKRIEFDLAPNSAELPDPNTPDGVSADEFLRALAHEGLKERLGTPSDAHMERLEYELGVIAQTGFAKYFLVVREFAQFARNKRIRFGPRGSAAGSLVSYAIGITDIDPVAWGLTFERFLNPERIAMPDIDMDFEDTRRDEVIRFAKERFGEDHVAQIITFGTMGARQSLRDAARALGIRQEVADRLCRLISSMPGATIQATLEEVEQFRTEYNSDQEARKLIDTAKSIEGIARHAGVHAAGIVISKEPIADLVPIARSTDGQPLTQYPMEILEQLGLLKMDILGLANLSVVSQCLLAIEQNGKGRIEIENIPLDDRKTYEMLARGETAGVFQLESAGMTRCAQQLKPDNLNEVAAMVALFRPGPMEHITHYIEGKFGRAKPKYLDPRMEPILRETYGVIVYQDQVLQLVRALAGFTLGEADVLRKAMGKKKKELLEESEAKFIAGAVANGMNEKNARAVFELLRPFAGYAFNKAHAVCYGLLAYQTAYLKANYPVEYMAAILSAYQDRTDKVVGYINECRRMGIEVMPPDINRSSLTFTVDEANNQPCIRFGLGATKGLGEAAISNILKARETGGPFRHLFELIKRVRACGGLNKIALEALIKSGALDTLHDSRAAMLEHLDAAISYAERVERDRASGQESLFGESSTPGDDEYPKITCDPLSLCERVGVRERELTRPEIRQMEREVLGLCLSDHPLSGMEEEVRRRASHEAAALEEVRDDEAVTLVGIVAERKDRTTRTGAPMATLVLEDLSGRASIVVFERILSEVGPVLSGDNVVVVKGKVRHRENGGEAQAEVIAQEIRPLAATEQPRADEAPCPGCLRIAIHRASPRQLQRALELISSHPGQYAVRIEVGSNGSPRHFRLEQRVSDGEWLRDLRRAFDLGFVRLERLGQGSWVESA